MPLRVATAVGLALYAAYSLFDLRAGVGTAVYEDWLYNALLVGAAALCLLRAAIVPEGRVAWLLLGAGLASWSAGEIVYTASGSNLGSGFPAAPDWLWLGFYPAVYGGLVVLLRTRVRRFYASLCVDGIIGALAAAAWVAALLFPALLAGTGGSGAGVLADLSYPVADVVLLGFVIWIMGLTGWRPGPVLGLVGAAFAIGALVDGFSLWWAASGHTTGHTAFDWLWPASALALGFAAWKPTRQAPAITLRGARPMLAPLLFAGSAVGLLVYGRVHRVDSLAFGLALATLAAAVARMALAFVENQRMADRSRHEALTDALTDLGNRRRLMRDLEETLQSANQRSPAALLLFDLDGFKLYNDTFGHPAGDALLAKLGANLRASVQPRGGRAYRLGGDEFSVLVDRNGADLERMIAAASRALSAQGRGFAVTTSCGSVELPTEARGLTVAMQLADNRLYAHKGGRRGGTRQQTSEVLKQVLKEREPGLHEHLDEVAVLARALARRLGFSPDELDVVGRAAELHDIGKIAVPETILSKTGSLDKLEWTIIRQHTLIGERILDAAPAMRPVAQVVRATHEHYDGAGYPDRLAGDAIPFGARVIAVCDAYDAMTSDRPYQGPLTPDEALAELRAQAGAQFDPFVVEAFAQELAEPPQRHSAQHEIGVHAHD
jgi:diguanylate cyclase (GGDEF)-like protein/putative nucleotidyltransferase with HDIG domain